MENMEEIESRKKRPVFLLVLCILSFVSTGFNFLGNFINIFKGPISQKELNEMLAESSQLISFLDKSGNSTNDNFYIHTLVLFITFGLGLFSVFRMYQGYKNGFHMYIIYNLISIVSIYISVPPSEVPSIIIIFSVIFSAFFIFLYSRNLYWMDK